jgi:ketosteroid isomerase-like protein
MLAGNPRLSMKVPIVLQNADLVLLVSDYTVVMTGVDGKPSRLARGAEVVCRQTDGTWRFVRQSDRHGVASRAGCGRRRLSNRCRC